MQYTLNSQGIRDKEIVTGIARAAAGDGHDTGHPGHGVRRLPAWDRGWTWTLDPALMGDMGPVRGGCDLLSDGTS